MRRWLRILPAVFITYSLAYLDRSNFGFGIAGGMAQSLSLSNQQISVLAAVFFLGYLVFMIPGSSMARKLSLRKLMTILLVMWGTFAALTGVVKSFALLVVIRLMLGLAESLILPAMLLLLTRWFTRAERSRANALLILGNPATVLWMSALTGYLIEGFGWRTTFLIEGIPSIIWGIVWYVTMRDHPSEAEWLPAEEREQLERTLALEQTEIQPMGVKQALLAGSTMVLAGIYFFWSLGMYGFVLWLPVIIHQGSQLAMGRSGLLTALPYAAGIIAMIAVSYLSDRTQRREVFVWPSLLCATIGLFGSYLFSSENFILAFACLMIGGAGLYAPYGPFFASIPEYVPANAAVEVIALINCFGALGGFVGTYLVGILQYATGSGRASFLLMSGSLFCGTLLCFFLKPANAKKSPAYA